MFAFSAHLNANKMDGTCDRLIVAIQCSTTPPAQEGKNKISHGSPISNNITHIFSSRLISTKTHPITGLDSLNRADRIGLVRYHPVRKKVPYP